MGATIFTFVLGVSIAAFFMWTGNNGQRRDREIELGTYTWAAEKRAARKTKREKSDSKPPEYREKPSYSRLGKQPRPMFGSFSYRDDRRPNSNRRACAGANRASEN